MSTSNSGPPIQGRRATQRTLADMFSMQVQIHDLMRAVLEDLERVLNGPQKYVDGLIRNASDTMMAHIKHDEPSLRQSDIRDDETQSLEAFVTYHNVMGDHYAVFNRMMAVCIEEQSDAVAGLRAPMSQSLYDIRHTLRDMMVRVDERAQIMTSDWAEYDPDSKIQKSFDKGARCFKRLEAELDIIMKERKSTLQPFLGAADRALSDEEKVTWVNNPDKQDHIYDELWITITDARDMDVATYVMGTREKAVRKFIAYTQLKQTQQLVRVDQQLQHYHDRLSSWREALPPAPTIEYEA